MPYWLRVKPVNTPTAESGKGRGDAAEHHDEHEALDAGADDYATKPLGMDELLARFARGKP